MRQLLGVEHVSAKTRKKLKNTRWSLSNLSLFGAVDMDLESLGYDSGNYWYNRTPDIESTYAQAESGAAVGDSEYDGLFLTFTSLKDRSKLRGNTHTFEAFNLITPKIFEAVGGSPGQRPEDYEELKKHLMEAMLNTTERVLPGVRDHLVFADIGTPATNRFYVRSVDGNMYGSEKSAWQVGPFAFSVRTEVKGLYLCGSSTLGHGVAGATMSGLVAAAKTLRCPLSELLTETDTSLECWPADDLAQWPERARQRAMESRYREGAAARG